MKKILILFVIVLSIISCSTREERRHNINFKDGNTRFTELITLTVDNESHEFVLYHQSRYSNGIEHWPGCKYCKQNNEGNNFPRLNIKH